MLLPKKHSFSWCCLSLLYNSTHLVIGKNLNTTADTHRKQGPPSNTQSVQIHKVHVSHACIYSWNTTTDTHKKQRPPSNIQSVHAASYGTGNREYIMYRLKKKKQAQQTHRMHLPVPHFHGHMTRQMINRVHHQPRLVGATPNSASQTHLDQTKETEWNSGRMSIKKKFHLWGWGYTLYLIA